MLLACGAAVSNNPSALATSSSSSSSIPPPSFGQTSVILNGNSYTLQSHPRVWLDGPSGALTRSLQNTSDKANTSNPAYQGLINNVGALITAGYANPWVDILGSASIGSNDTRFSNAAILWWAQGANVSDPNGYLAAAKYGLDHIEDLIGSTSACDEIYSGGYCNGRSNDIDYGSEYVIPVMQAYSIIRSQMSSAERTAFANKMLNDNAQLLNGLGLAGSPTSSCTRASGGGPGSNDILTGTGTITFSYSGPGVTTTMTGVGTAFTTQTPVGTVIFPLTGVGNFAYAKVTAVSSSTSATVVSISRMTSSGFRYAPSWNTSVGTDCGIVWLLKHHNAGPPLDTTRVASYNMDYYKGGSFPYTAGIGTIAPIMGENNLTLTKLYSYIAIGAALADDDARAVTLLQQAYNFYYTYMLPWKLSQDTGMTSCGASYNVARCQYMLSGIDIIIKNSIVSGPNLVTLSSNGLSRQVPYFQYNILPDQTFSSVYLGTGSQNTFDLWNSPYGINGSAWGQRPLVQAQYLNINSTETQWAQSYLQHHDYTASQWQHYGGSYLPPEYVFYDPAATATSYTNAPTQYAFRKSDFAACVATGMSCFSNISVEMAISKSDWTSSATQMMMQGGYCYNGIDHFDACDWGSYHIYRKGYLLAGSGYNTSTEANGNLYDDDVIALGGGNLTTNAGYAPMSRWASTDPTGDSSSRYAYAMYNLTNVYTAGANATGVYRHEFHFKKSGAPDYVLDFSDVTASSGELMQGYYHYWRNSGTNTITYNASARTMANLNGSTALLLTSFIPTSANSLAMSKDNSDGSYRGQPAANTYRIYVCASSDGSTCNSFATHGEWWAVHLPTTNLSATMPAITQPTCSGTGGSCAAVQIADATTPKVAVVARSGVTLTQASFTSTHNGTAQYVVAGLAPGIYNVTVGGSTVVSGATVNANDNTLYFESTSGAAVVTQTGGVPLR
jgi:hypothetical protein